MLPFAPDGERVFRCVHAIQLAQGQPIGKPLHRERLAGWLSHVKHFVPMLRAAMPVRIGPSRPTRQFLSKWREHRGLTQQQLADRIETGKDQISRWENGKRGMSAEVLNALAEALQIEPADLFRDPDMPSADELLRSATPEQRRLAIDLVERIVRPTAGTRR